MMLSASSSRFITRLILNGSASSRGCYKSSYDTETFYNKHPALKNAFQGVPKIAATNDKEFNGYIPLEKLKISYSLSTGPGGQHVNTTESRAEVRFHVQSADWIPEKIRSKFFDKFSHKISKEGFFTIRSERTRHQSVNLADCLDKLRFSIRECTEEFEKRKEPDEEYKLLVLERQALAANRRLEEKRRRAKADPAFY